MSGSSEPGAGDPAVAESGPGDTEFAEDVVLAADLHLRPAGLVVRAAAPYAADVELVAAGRVARASSVLEVMGLGVRAGTAVTVRGRGADAAEAVRAVGGVLRGAA